MSNAGVLPIGDKESSDGPEVDFNPDETIQMFQPPNSRRFADVCEFVISVVEYSMQPLRFNVRRDVEQYDIDDPQNVEAVTQAMTTEEFKPDIYWGKFRKSLTTEYRKIIDKKIQAATASGVMSLAEAQSACMFAHALPETKRKLGFWIQLLKERDEAPPPPQPWDYNIRRRMENSRQVFMVLYTDSPNEDAALISAFDEEEAVLKYKTQYHCFTNNYMDYVFGLKRFNEYENQFTYGHSHRPFADKFWFITRVEKWKNGKTHQMTTRGSEETFIKNVRAFFGDQQDLADLFLDYELKIKKTLKEGDGIHYEKEMVAYIRLHDDEIGNPDVYRVDDLPMIG